MPSPNDRRLLQAEVTGGFTDEVLRLLQADRMLVFELATILLEGHFAETLHEDILQRVGLDSVVYRKKPRDPRFRERILIAYEYCCAVCGFNVRLGHELVAVEAAHIQWHQSGGPDREENGIALCSLHHKLFDRRVFTISPERQLLVAETANGTQGFYDWLMRYHGTVIRSPIRPEYVAGENFLHWHMREVFRGPARYVIG